MSPSGGQNSWPQSQTHADLQRNVQKRLLHEERRPQVRQAADLLGPGMGPRAVRLFDWNDDATAFNGLFYSEPGAQNSPDGNVYWMGLVIANEDGYGYQEVYEFRQMANPGEVPQQWLRTFQSISGTTRTYGAWHRVGSGHPKNVGAATVTTNTGPTGVGVFLNINTVTLPFPYSGRKYRVTAQVTAQSDAVGGFTTVNLRHGLSITNTGTIFGEALMDHRTASRRQGVGLTGEFTYAGVDGATPYNVVVTILGGGGNSTSVASASVPSLLTVDEIVP